MQSINRNTALRIALAARALPEVEVGTLVEILRDKINGEINEESLTTVTVTDLKVGLTPEDGEAPVSVPQMKEAVRILWGELDDDKLPEAKALDVVPSRSVRVAISSNSGDRLDGHFGSCLRFLIYQVTDDWYQLIDIRSAMDADLAEDKNAYRVSLIDDCQVAYVVSVGGPAAAKIVRAGVYPIKKATGGESAEVINQLQEVMKNSPPPWLAKHIGDAPEARVRFEREEA